MWKAGDTFKGNVIKKGNEHLHIVLSDPYLSETGETVVLTFMSTYNGKESIRLLNTVLIWFLAIVEKCLYLC